MYPPCTAAYEGSAPSDRDDARLAGPVMRESNLPMVLFCLMSRFFRNVEGEMRRLFSLMRSMGRLVRFASCCATWLYWSMGSEFPFSSAR